MKQNARIDYLKAFSSILVVFYHTVLLSDIYWGSLPWICTVIALEDVHVPLFLVLAGYLCHKQDIRLFYLKKLRRIGIPFLFMSCLKLLFSNVFSGMFAHSGDIWQQLYDAFVCGQLYWFCYCLLVLFALAPLFWERRRVTMLLLFVFLAVNTVLRLYEVELPNVLQLSRVISMFPFFLSGMLLKDLKAFERIQQAGKKMQVLLLFCCLAAGIACGYLRFFRDVHTVYLVDFFLGISLMYLLYLFACCIPDGIFGRLLSVAGRYSLQIMLLDSFYRILLFWLFRLFLPVSLLLILLVTAAVILLSCLTCLLLEKIPLLSVLLGLKEIRH